MAGESNIGGADFYKMTAEQQAIGAMADRTSAARAAALQAQINVLQAELSKDKQYTALAEQIRALSDVSKNSAQYQNALAALTAQRNMGTGDLASALNFQVSDEQILSDINSGQYSRLQDAINQGQGRVAFLTDRIASVNNLMQGLPENDARKISSAQLLKELNSDLSSAQSGLVSNQKALSDFKPIEVGSSEAKKIVSGFRESIKLPEERALNQIRQIDPTLIAMAEGLSGKYAKMAGEELPTTTTPSTQQLRSAIEQETINQLRLGSTIGAEERRGYEQAIRAAQTARGNIFGMGPAVQEAAQIGAAGEQRKLARYGAAQQFLSSGQTTEDALRADIAFRDALQRTRLGEAANFIATGPSPYMLGQARTAQQQAAYQNYINASMAQPGQFTPQTYQTPGYQFVNPEIPGQLAGQQGSMFSNLYGQQGQFASNIYGTQAGMYNAGLGYMADTYGAQTRAIASQPSAAQTFGEIAGGLSNLIRI
jgi:hypothetical protein